SKSLSEAILAGDQRSASRLMRLIDDGLPVARAELAALFPHTGRAYLVGVTGNPGSGKSTLVNQLITRFRAAGHRVGCIAIDPTSPFSGGAILGDRVRMQEHALDDGVFIRSVATRGNMGGLSRSTPAMVQILDAMGYDVIIIETVGVGQGEVEIVGVADCTLVVLTPGQGDGVQAVKAGVMEIADIFVINKADIKGADRHQRELRTMLNLREAYTSDEWRPKILRTIATNGTGVDDLMEAIDDHKTWLDTHRPTDVRQARRLAQLIQLIASQEMAERMERVLATLTWQGHFEAVVDHREDPYQAAERLLKMMFPDP
ncbi:MAG: methylmalonyl Co-A mutase-associated GTPase MeaB, partial [Bradymonadaceae bacterium]